MSVRSPGASRTVRDSWARRARPPVRAAGLLRTLAVGGAVLISACEDAPTTPAPVPLSTQPAPPEPQPPGCSDLLELEFVGRNEAAGAAMGELTLRALDESGATLDFVRPYAILVPEGGANLDVPGLSPTVGVFVSELRFEPEDGWFQQTATLEWVSDLEVRATAAGCDPAVALCDSAGCTTPSG